MDEQNEQFETELEEEFTLEDFGVEEDVEEGEETEEETEVDFTYDDEGNVVIEEDESEVQEEEEAKPEESEVETEPKTDERDAEIAKLRKELSERDSLIRDVLKTLGTDEEDAVVGLEKLAAESEDMTVEEFRKKRQEKAKEKEDRELLRRIQFEETIRQDLAEIHAAYPETKAYKSVREFPQLERFAQLRDAGLSAKEAYIASHPDSVRASVATAARQQARNEGKSHLHSSVPKGARDRSVVISKKQLAEYRELFPEKSDKEIIALYKQASSK